MSDTQDLKGKIALVTGASRGIGRAVALDFGRRGAHVIALARTVGALEELDDEIQSAGGESATLVPLDLKDGDGIDRMGGAIAERWGRLDIFVGNAGQLGKLSPIAHLQPKTWDDVMAINVTANYRLIRSLDPLLRAADAGRAVFISSGAAHKAVAYWGLYATSKAALEKMVEVYAAETAKSNLRVNILNPGATATDMRAAAFPGEDPETLKKPEDLLPLFNTLISPDLGETGQVFNAE